MIRLFAALPIPDEIAQGLVRRQQGVEFARWRAPAGLHVTLRFFGEVREDVADDLDAELSIIAGQPFQLSLQGVGTFGEGPDVRILWAGVEESPLLRQLAGRCEAAARRAGLKPEGRQYHPHVTLASTRRPDVEDVARWVQSHNLLKSPPFTVASFGLYSSRLTSEGAHYRLEREYPLR